MKKFEKKDFKVDFEISSEQMKEIACNYKEAQKLASKIEKELDIYAFIVRKHFRIIAVEHMDGSYLEFHSACFRKLSKDFFAVFTEHHGTHVYHKDDVKFIKEWLNPNRYLFYNSDY